MDENEDRLRCLRPVRLVAGETNCPPFTLLAENNVSAL